MRCISTFTIVFTVFVLCSSITQADPSTQPVASADVYLIPFSPIGGDMSLDWAGKAVQQNLLTDLARAKLHVAAADKPIENASDAQTAAKAVGARYIINGTYQVADTQVRFNGQVFDAVTGNVIGGLSATGAPRDLFNLEDSLTTQALAELKQLPVLANNKPAAAPVTAQPQVVVQLVQPALVQVGTSSSYQGSALQQYVDSNRTPSTDYAQQAQNAQDRETYDWGYNNSLYTPYLGGLGYGGYGYGYGLIYSVTPGYHIGSGAGEHHHHGDER